MKLHPDTPGLSQRQGVLVVEPDATRLQSLIDTLAPLRASTVGATSAAAALAILMEAEPPEVLLMAGTPEDMGASDLCHRIRADGRLANAYIIMMGEGEPEAIRQLGRCADEHVPKEAAGDLLRLAVRAGLRAQAQRRLAARQERRRAIIWLGQVVAHELNNPLAAAITAQQRMAELVDATTRTPEDEAELKGLVVEARDLLLRMRTAASRLLVRQRQRGGGCETLELPDFVHRLRERLDATARQYELYVDRRSAPSATFDVVLILDAVKDLLAGTSRFGTGAVDVRVHFDNRRVAVILGVHAVDGAHPEAVLEPHLVQEPGAPPRLEPGLAALEDCFERNGGQIFVSRVDALWRFGLTLPGGD
jgi:DNA-binding response OmpR family regulator